MFPYSNAVGGTFWRRFTIKLSYFKQKYGHKKTTCLIYRFSRPEIRERFFSQPTLSPKTRTQIMYNPQIQIFAESETKRPKFGLWNKTKRSKKRTSAQHKNAAFRAAFSLVFAKYSNVLIIVFKGLGSLSQNHAACQLCPLYNIMSVYPAL